MKNKLLLGVGIAAGYVLGSRSGRAAYDKLKARAASIWDSKPVQDKVAMATGTIKEKAPEVADQLSEAARRAGTVIGSAVHREGSSGNGTGNAGSAGVSGGGAAGTLGEDHIPAHRTHPETSNLGTTDGNGTKA
ncbi:MAG: YtxH domain-containing protein [Pseudarthrobacter sp.]|nr:YtxH domain-containing protein [Pseudarthrobacter sp.]